MSEYYRVKHTHKAAHLIDDEGNYINPHAARAIIKSLQDTLNKPTYVYFGHRYDDTTWKIGISVDPHRRSNEVEIIIEVRWPCYDWGIYSARNIEAALHNIFRCTGQHIEKEWFTLSDYDIALLQCYKPKIDSYDKSIRTSSLKDVLVANSVVSFASELSDLLSHKQFVAMCHDVREFKHQVGSNIKRPDVKQRISEKVEAFHPVHKHLILEYDNFGRWDMELALTMLARLYAHKHSEAESNNDHSLFQKEYEQQIVDRLLEKR